MPAWRTCAAPDTARGTASPGASGSAARFCAAIEYRPKARPLARTLASSTSCHCAGVRMGIRISRPPLFQDALSTSVSPRSALAGTILIEASRRRPKAACKRSDIRAQGVRMPSSCSLPSSFAFEMLVRASFQPGVANVLQQTKTGAARHGRHGAHCRSERPLLYSGKPTFASAAFRAPGHWRRRCPCLKVADRPLCAGHNYAQLRRQGEDQPLCR